MKQKLIIAMLLLASWATVNAQEVMDAYKLSQTELTGTARSVAMGGAMGAVGGDISAVAINPAGIGVFRSSQIVTTLNFQNVENKAESNMGTFKKDKFKVNFNNLAFVATFPMQNDVAPYVSFGFSYNKLKDFNKSYKVSSDYQSHSLSDYMGARADLNRLGASDLSLKDHGNDLWKNTDWLSILGYNSFLLTEDASGALLSSTAGLRTGNDLYIREKGSVDSYDFNAGTTFENIISVGMKISVTDIKYKMSSMYTEEFEGNAGTWAGYDLYNNLETEGTGWNIGLGAILQPIEELRIGVAYHSPTWYRMTDYYGAEVEDNFNSIADHMHWDNREYKPGTTTSGDYWYRHDYKLTTPDKWVFSLAGIIGKEAIISLDYELVDYSKMKFKERNNSMIDYPGINADIKSEYRLASTIRVGGEYRFTPQLSGRIGYSWQQAPYKTEFTDFLADNEGEAFYEMVPTAGAVPHFIAYGDTNYITWGLGYKFTKNIFTDLAFVYRSQKSELYSYSKSDQIKVKENTFQGALTLGFRF